VDWPRLSMNTYTTSFWEKVGSLTKFLATLLVVVGFIYAFTWTADELSEHIHIRVDRAWWAHQVWHSWWWVIVPMMLVGMGRILNRRTLGQGLWAVGLVWLAILAASAALGLWGVLLKSLVTPFGWLIGNFLALIATLAAGACFAFVGILVGRARKASRLFDRLVAEICWSPKSKHKAEPSRNVP